MPNRKRTKSQSHQDEASNVAAAAGTDHTSTIPPKRPKMGQLKAQVEKSLVETVNALSIQDFSNCYLPERSMVLKAIRFESPIKLELQFTSWSEMPLRRREECLDLVQATSSAYYHVSETGWSRTKKREEMRHPAMKYLLLPSPSPGADPDHGLGGFVSFMVTEEDEFEVIYCYELHLQLSLRGKALGKRLMEVMEMVGAGVGVQKAMLTVFKSNKNALTAYTRWGYQLDDFSPEPTKLRDGTVKEPSYLILSKEAKDFAKPVISPEPSQQ